ncbi:MAG: AIM24 family protein, partial [Verrucomicrobiota bacterium]
GKRVLTKESIFMTHFTNQEPDRRVVAFASPFPGKIVELDMSQFNDFICQKDSFLCAALGTEISIAFNKKLGAGFFGGEGFILQKISGDGKAYIHAGGTVIRKELNNGVLKVDTGCIVGFDSTIDYDIEMVKGLKSMFFGGEGLFFATLRGTGSVYLQSLPFSRMAERIVRNVPSAGSTGQGEGSILRGIGDLLDGDR